MVDKKKNKNIRMVAGMRKAQKAITREPKKLEGVSESNQKQYGDDSKIQFVLQDNIAKTCIHILTSLVNQNMKVTSKNKKIADAINLFNRNAKIKHKIDSIVFNQVVYGYTTYQYSIVNTKVKVFDTSTYTLVYDTILDEFLGIHQKTTYEDPNELKKGQRMQKDYEMFLDKDLKRLVLVNGMGRGIGESLVLPAYPYVYAKKELIDSLYDLVKRLGLLTVITLDFPGDLGDDDVDEFLTEVKDMIREATANDIWLFPTGTNVEGVRGSGESKVIESVKVMIEFLDEEIRKCFFIPDTFLSSLSANRATAKEQRYLISSMVDHIRDLIEQSLIDMYDMLLRVYGFLKEDEVPDYEFSWGNINLPEPETLVAFMIQLADRLGMDIDELRAYVNLGVHDGEIDNPYSLAQEQSNSQDIYSLMGYNQNSTKNMSQAQREKGNNSINKVGGVNK